MSISHAILGILSHASLTGYDLKKIMQESSFMYWSGNNNQIYKVLVELHDQGYVTNEVLHQSNSPSKKVYTITPSGLAELKRWTQSEPEPPEIKKPFLIQMAWSAQLSNAQIRALLNGYERSINDQIAMAKAKCEKKHFAPDRTEREIAIWDAIDESIIETYVLELRWIDKLRTRLATFDDAQYEQRDEATSEIDKESGAFDHYILVEGQGESYILLDASGIPINSERDALDLVSICAQNGCNRLLIPGERLSEDFLRLSTGIAGAILGRFSTYGIQVAVVLEDQRINGRFKDFAVESNRGSAFRIYPGLEEAEQWLWGQSTNRN